jgi:excisionase family DNA binding protein
MRLTTLTEPYRQADDDKVLTVAEVAAELRCSKPHVFKAILGKVRGVTPLPAISMGRRKLVRRSSLQQWKRDNEQAGERNDILIGSPEVDAVRRA